MIKFTKPIEDIIMGIICGLLGYLLIVTPILSVISSRKPVPEKPIIIYFEDLQ